MSDQIHAITGAFGYSGRYIAQRLLNKGEQVITLTNSIYRANSFGGQVKAFPFNFEEPEKLVENLKGVQVLYNTYWVRFNHKLFQHASAVDNTLILFDAAQKAGVERIVHVSITNPSLDSDLEYFNGKARLEQALMTSGLSYAILRPTVLFGKEDILINNIAWLLRHLPVFGVFGDGQYRLQPIYVDDLAQLAVGQGQARENVIINAIGPETFTYEGLVKTIAQIIGLDRPVWHISDGLGYWAGRLISCLKGDITITREEIEGLKRELLYVDSPPAGHTQLSDWAKAHTDTLGKHYANELKRRKNRQQAYSK